MEIFTKSLRGTCSHLLAALLLFVLCVPLSAQNVTISPTSGKFIPGVAGGNTGESGKVAGFYSTWVHEQLSLTVNTSDIANLTQAGEIADPACTLGTYNGKLFLANGATQTFMTVSLPKGYRITGYTIVLQPDLKGVKLTDSNKDPANNFQNTGTHATCFYETEAWDSEFPYYANSKTAATSLSSGQYLAVATASDDDIIMNPGDDANKTFTITRTAQQDANGEWDMDNHLYFWVGFGTSYYAFSINSFEIYFTAEGTFEAEVLPTGVGTATNYTTSPFTTSKTDLGNVTYNSDLGRYVYTYENVRDVKGYIHLYQKSAVSDDYGVPVAGEGTIYPVEVNSEGHYAFGNNEYYIEPPISYNTTSGIKDNPIGYRIVGVTFTPLWAKEVTGGTQTISSSCQIYRSTSNGYLTAALDLGKQNNGGSSSYTNTAAIWQFDEYGNMYIGSGDDKQYLACYGEGNIRQLSLSSAATGDAATWNLRRASNGRIYYKSDSNKYYYLYTKTVTEGSSSTWRGFLITDGVAYPNSVPDYYSTTDSNSNANGYTAVTSTNPGSTTVEIPSFTPSKYTITVYDKTGKVAFDPIEISGSDDVDLNKKFSFDDYNNDAVKFVVSEVSTGCQALFDVTLKLEALNPYIDQMTVVCSDPSTNVGTEEDPQPLRITQTFTASDFGVNGGAFHFSLPSSCDGHDVNITFEDLYSHYGDDSYIDGSTNSARYSFVTSPYFSAFDGYQKNAVENTYSWMNDASSDAGLYDKRYDPDIASTKKIYTGVAGDVAFTFNNASVLTQGGTFREYAFSVERYLAPTSTTYDDGSTGAGGKFATIVMNPNPDDDDEGEPSGTYYLFIADETRYNIAPTTAWQHRYYAFYRMYITLAVANYSPKVEFVPIYKSTFNGSDNGAYYGAIVTAPYTEDGVTKQGYAQTDEIFAEIKRAIADEEVTDKPSDAKHLLYLDFSNLAGIFQIVTEEHQSMDDYSGTNSPNCIIFLPVGATATNNNVAYKTKAGTFRMAKNLVLTDKEPFYTPYNIYIDTEAYATYTRQITVDKNGKVSNATVILPYALTVNSKGVHTNKKSDFTFSLNQLSTSPSAIKLDEDGILDESTSTTPYTGYFTPVESAEANTPYMVQVTSVNSDDETVSFIATEYGATIKATTDMASNYLFKGENRSVTIKDNGSYTFTNYGGYSGKEYEKNKVKIFYFANNKYVTSEELLRATVKVYPFRAVYDYSGSTLSAKAISGFKVAFGEPNTATAIEDVEVANCDLAIGAGNGIITVESAIDQPVKIASMSGVSVLNVEAKAGETYTKRVPAGVYVINNKKIIVK